MGSDQGRGRNTRIHKVNKHNKTDSCPNVEKYEALCTYYPLNPRKSQTNPRAGNVSIAMELQNQCTINVEDERKEHMVPELMNSSFE